MVFPAFAAVGKGAASGDAPVIVQGPDKPGIRLMGLHLLTEGHHLFQIQPVAVQNMKMENHRAVAAGYRAIEVIEIAEQIAVKQTKQGNIGHRGQTRRLL